MLCNKLSPGLLLSMIVCFGMLRINIWSIRKGAKVSIFGILLCGLQEQPRSDFGDDFGFAERQRAKGRGGVLSLGCLA